MGSQVFSCFRPADSTNTLIDTGYEVMCLLMGFRVGLMDGIASILRMAFLMYY